MLTIFSHLEQCCRTGFIKITIVSIKFHAQKYFQKKTAAYVDHLLPFGTGL